MIERSAHNEKMEARTASTQDIRMLEFFSGIGGMRLAVEKALQHLGDKSSARLLVSCQAYDISLHANRCYEHNFHRKKSGLHGINNSSDSAVSTKLVEQLKPHEVDGKADLWTLSPPCQPFTTNGKNKKCFDRDDKRCAGLIGLMQLLTTIQNKPYWIFLENVQGFAGSIMAQDWYQCLENNGYSYRAYLLSPLQFGIPNHRQRFYIMAERSERWKQLDLHCMPIHRTLLPSLLVKSSPERVTQRTVADYLTEDTVSREKLKEYLVPESVLCKDFSKNFGIVTAADTATHCFTAGYGRIYHRSTGSLLLMPVEGSITPLPAMSEQPLDRTDMVLYNGRLRRFTPQELLRMFAFPKEFEFHCSVPLEHQYKLIGNTISVSVVTALMTELLNSRLPLVKDGKQTVLVGGSKGHVEEEITGPILAFYQRYRWKMIPSCTGRYTCRDHQLVSNLSPLQLLEHAELRMSSTSSWKEFVFDVPNRPDRVVVVPMDVENTVGLITFVKNDPESFVHTLNTPSGFRRKLEAIGIRVTAKGFFAISIMEDPKPRETEA